MIKNYKNNNSSKLPFFSTVIMKDVKFSSQILSYSDYNRHDMDYVHVSSSHCPKNVLLTLSTQTDWMNQVWKFLVSQAIDDLLQSKQLFSLIQPELGTERWVTF